MSQAQRKYLLEVSSLVNNNVTVITVENKKYSGTLSGINPDQLSLCLSNAKDSDGKAIPKLVISGRVVAKVFLDEKPFDLNGLAERLERVFPRMVRLYENEGFIWVMDKVKVTEEGIKEGSGPIAERVQRVHSQFLKETKG